MQRRMSWARLVAPAGVALSFAPAAPRAPLNNTADDALGQSSFNTGLHWSDSTAPSAVNQYDNAGFLLRTPGDANNYTFGGGSLTITSTAAFGTDLNDSL